MSDQSLGQRSRSSKRSISAVIQCVVSGIAIGIASTQAVYGQDRVPSPPVDLDSYDPVSAPKDLQLKRNEFVVPTDVPLPRPVGVAEILGLLDADLQNPFAKEAGSNDQEKAVLTNSYAVANTVEALLQKAHVCDQEKKWVKSLEYYNQAIVCSPGTVEIRFNRASVLISLGRFSEALNDLDFFIQQKSDLFCAYAMRGYVRFMLVKLDGDDAAFKPALADITRALELKPNDPYSRSVRGMIAARRDDYDQAIADLSWAIEHQCDGGDARYFRGCSFATKGETDRAIADLTEALKSFPKSDDIYNRRAQLYAGQGDVDRALADLDQVVRLRPDDAIGYLQRTVLLMFKGDKRRALADIENVVHLHSESSVVRFMHAIMLYLAEPESDRALAEMDKAIGLDPRVILYPAFRCFLNAKKNKYGPVFKDLAICTAILAQSRLGQYVNCDTKLNRFEVVAGLVTHDRCTLGFLGRIDFEQSKFFFGIGFTDDPNNLEHKNQVSGIDQQLINQNVLTLLAATFAGASH